MHNRRRQQGFSLVELLVAITIFITVMSGLALLFAGAMDTVRQGTRMITANELGRDMLTVLERDLKAAFAARELGEFYQFYGMPNGFMYVGVLEGGQLGRVTYAFNPDVDPETRPIDTEFFEPWDRMRDRVHTNVRDLFGTAAANQWVDEHFPDDFCEPDPNNPSNPGVFRVPCRNGVPDPAVGVSFPVRVLVGGLLRYAEPGVNNLNTFTLPGALVWPYIDPLSPDRDNFAGGPEGQRLNLYRHQLAAINPSALPPGQQLSDTQDIRWLMDNYRFDPNAHLYAIHSGTVQEVLNSKRRELWIRMLAGDPSLPDYWAYRWQEFGDQPRDYAVVENIATFAALKDHNGDILTVQGEEVNALTGIFTYSNRLHHSSRYFNMLQNIEGYESYLREPTMARLGILDERLQRLLGGTRLASDSLGNPLLPQLPSMVQPGFWIMREPSRPGGPELRHWFTQGVDVPSAIGRNLGAALQASPGQT